MTIKDDKTPADKVPLCNNKELESFYDSLSESNTRPAILSLIPQFQPLQLFLIAPAWEREELYPEYYNKAWKLQ